MSAVLLPDSRITSMVMGNDIFAYAQAYDGDLYQFVGAVEDGVAYYGQRRKSGVIIERLRGSKPGPNAPKLFTPLAAVSFVDELNKPMAEKFVFYLDDNNILHDQYYNSSTNNEFQHGTLSNLKIQCAHYSSLAAVTIKGDVVNHMCLFYQTPDKDASVKMVSFAGWHRTWEHGKANLRDPPLYGTSLTAVPPRPGYLGRGGSDDSNKGQPIYYLQMDNNAVGSGQGTSEPLPLSGYDNDGKPVAFPPHTSLTAVDNGSQLHLIYKSHSGKVKVIRLDPNQGLQVPELFFHDLNVAPRSYISACLAPNTGINTSIVLFYQVLDEVSRKVQMTARVVSRPAAAASGTQWNVSDKEILGV
ncbi:hypothetical protein F5144DRAFT_586428 [Chaetomium tenue]|uniref:Uncharacterized protein n=1 Tax=Chaetomium tenue TaxID=1854479 RepID=A0ACB7NYZ4_9PEZI|nr:hypothetical protein F5144DRAFT_586428 [Chaetomium globosum]